MGFFVGDGCWIFRPRYWSYITKFVLNARTEKALAIFLTVVLSKNGINPWATIESNRLNVEASSKGLQDFLRKYVKYELEGHKLRKRLLLSEIFKKKKEFTFGILAGLIDSDGYVGYGGYKKHSLSVIITTASEVLATLMIQLAKELHMAASITRQYSGFNTSGYTFYVRILTHSAIANAGNIKSLKLQQVLNGRSYKTIKKVGP